MVALVNSPLLSAVVEALNGAGDGVQEGEGEGDDEGTYCSLISALVVLLRPMFSFI